MAGFHLRAAAVALLAWAALAASPPAAAQSLPVTAALMQGGPCARTLVSVAPSTGPYCAGGRNNGALTAVPGFSATRASAGYAETVAGVQVAFAANAPRVTDKGWLLETARTQSLRNSMLAGAAVGTPPTNFSTAGTASPSIAAVGTASNGLPYIDFRCTSGGAGFCDLRLEAANQVAASDGQAWTESAYVAVAAGSTTNVGSVQFRAARFQADGATSGGSSLGTDLTLASLGASLSRQQVTLTPTSSSSLAFLQPFIRVNLSGAADITLRISGPQFEQGSSASSFMATTGTATFTRAADVASLAFYPASTGITITYGSGSTATPSQTSPLNLGASSGGAWLGNYVTAIVARP